MRKFTCEETNETVIAKTYKEAVVKMFGEIDVKAENWDMMVRRIYMKFRHGVCTVEVYGTDSDDKDKFGLNNVPDMYTIKEETEETTETTETVKEEEEEEEETAKQEKEETKMGTKETTWVVNGITVEIWRYGCDDYAANFYEMDYSIRGTLKQVMDEISSVCGEEN